jgi:hypothetical protein
MSTRIGTLKPTRGRSIWPAAFMVSFVMLTIAVVIVSLDRGEPSPATTSRVEAPAVEIVSGTAANTPSELRGATTADRGGAGISFVRHVPRYGIGANATESGSPELGSNTPSELSGGMSQASRAEIWAREHMRRP